MSTTCEHVRLINPHLGRAPYACQECVALGDGWVHLRRCLICGHVGCCDSSKNRHATHHYHATHHPIVQSYEPDEDWLWCYADRAFLERAAE